MSMEETKFRLEIDQCQLLPKINRTWLHAERRSPRSQLLLSLFSHFDRRKKERGLNRPQLYFTVGGGWSY
jgi:hypothetical protein